MATPRMTSEPHAPPRWPILKSVTLGRGGQSIMLNRSVCVVGARSAVHLPLPSPLVSRTHALIVNDEHYVRDRNSEHGVFIRGTRVREVELRSGDDLRVGRTRFRYETANDRLSAEDLAGLAEAANTNNPSLSNAGLSSRTDLGGLT